MRKVAKLLTDYVIKKSMVDEADREVYEYGFVITLEVGLFLVASLFIALKLDMVLEGIFFFVIFSPLRSYAGGLHLEKFWICFVLSCLTYITTLLVVKNLCLHEFVSLIVLFALEVFVSDMSFQISEIDIEDTITFVTLYESMEYVDDGVVKTADIEHNLTIMYDEAYDVAKVVSDSYRETVSGFQSCSYVSEEIQAVSEALYSLNSINTDYCAEIVRVAESQVGYKEKASNSDLDSFTANAGSANYTKYGQWYGLNPAAWCAIFVSWCASEAGVSTSVIPKYSSCSTGMKNFKDMDCFYYSSAYNGSYTPEVGDIFFTGTSTTSSSHTGIVVEVSSTQITVVDGNWSDKVSRHTYNLTDSSLIGFASPIY